MKSRSSFAEFIQNAGAVLFPGGMGTELQRRGYKSALPLWSAAANLDAPGLVEQIHTDYLEAGASVAITNSFRTTPRAFAKAGRKAEALGALQGIRRYCIKREAEGGTAGVRGRLVRAA